MFPLIFDDTKKFGEFAVVFGRYGDNTGADFVENIEIKFEVGFPFYNIDIEWIDFEFVSIEQFKIVIIKIVIGERLYIGEACNIIWSIFIQSIDFFDNIDFSFNFGDETIDGFDKRANVWFEPLEKHGSHEFNRRAFATDIAECLIKKIGIFITCIQSNIIELCVNSEFEFIKLSSNRFNRNVAHAAYQRIGGNVLRIKSCREFTDIAGVVKMFYELARTGNRECFEQREIIGIHILEETFDRAFVVFEFHPLIEILLRSFDHQLNAVNACRFECIVFLFGNKIDLALEILQFDIDRCCREHQDFGFDAGLHGLQQFLISRCILCFFFTAVGAEIVRFVDNNQIKVVPVEFW